MTSTKNHHQQSIKRSVVCWCALPLLLVSSLLQANKLLVVDTIDSNEYGYAFNGVYSNIETADFSFVSNDQPLRLTLDAFDIDFPDEVEVLLNGAPITNLNTTGNNASAQDSFVISAVAQVNGTNTLQFRQKIPGWKWGLTNLILTVDGAPELQIDITNTNAYGYAFNGVYTNQTDATFKFLSSSSDLTLSLDTFDIDTNSELNVLLNGQSIGHLPTTSNNSFGTATFSIAATQQNAGMNTLRFVQSNPGWIWGIQNLLLTEQTGPTLVVGVVDTGDYGNRFNGVFENPVEASFDFEGTGDLLALSVTTYDIDSPSEISVSINGVSVGNLAVTDNNGLGSSTITLPLVAQGSSNTLTFTQSIPGWTWGITDILLSEASAPRLTRNVVHTTAYGNAYSGAINTPSNADFTFTGASYNLLLELDTFDIDYPDEVSILVNGELLGYLATTPNNGNGTTSLLIPSHYQLAGVNELSFVQKTPGWRWGISNILLSDQSTSVPNIDNYDLVFFDEFSGSSLDSNNWNTGLLWGPYLPINAEQQLYVDTLGINQSATYNPFEFTGNSLIIKATPVSGSVQPPPRPAENDPIWDQFSEYRFNGPSTDGPGYDANDVDYLSGIITSNESFNMTHGYVEARVKLPAGQGLWPAFWLLNKHYVEDVPEIDVMEFLGQNVDKVYHTYHYFDIQNDWAKISTPTFESTHADWTQEFHTFGMAWSPNEIVWYVDGVEAKRITDSEYKIPNQSMYILANLAVGGNWPGDADASTPFPARYEIDYIRAYKKKLNPTLDLANDYQLMFNDEFDGNALDTNKWNTSFLWGPYLAINNEEQYYVDTANSDQNVGYTPFTVANGTLTITAESSDESPPNVPPTSLPGPNEQIWKDNPAFQQGPYAGAPDYTSGVITSYDSFKFVNGYAEIRAKVPNGDGLWPAFWLLNAYYVGTLPEIDIMEIVGESPHLAYQTFHRSANDGTPLKDQYVNQYGSPSVGYSDDFHTFGVRWQPGEITWYVDGVATSTYTESGDDNKAYQVMYVIANLAVGGNFNQQPVDPAALPAEYIIDYIRVYQEKDTP